MPEGGVEYVPHGDLLSFQEIRRAVACLARLGVHAVRLTGGEPMARRGCLELVSMLKDTPGIDRVTMTTNGILLKGRVAEAAAAGLNLRALMRGGCGDEEMTDAIRGAIRNKPRRHGFEDDIEDREPRRMNRIGGVGSRE